MGNDNRQQMKNRSTSYKLRTAALILAVSATIPLPGEAAPLPSRWFDACILRPTRYPAGEYHVKMVDGIPYSDVFIPTESGQILHGWFFETPGAKKTVLVSHGIGGNISSRIDLIHLFLQSGVSVFIYDYQGYGRSTGSASLKSIVSDGRTAYNYLTQDCNIKPDDLVLAGESLGTSVACALASHVPAAGLILQSPFSSLAERCAQLVPILRVRAEWLQPIAGLANDKVLVNPHPPLLIVHGSKDRLVPVSHAFKLYRQAVEPKQLVVVHRAGHTGDPHLMASPEYFYAVQKFLSGIDQPVVAKHNLPTHPTVDESVEHDQSHLSARTIWRIN